MVSCRHENFLVACSPCWRVQIIRFFGVSPKFSRIGKNLISSGISAPSSEKAPICQNIEPVDFSTRTHSFKTLDCSLIYISSALFASYSLPRLYGGELTMRSTEESGMARSRSRQSPRKIVLMFCDIWSGRLVLCILNHLFHGSRYTSTFSSVKMLG